jgi:hypothetical protein
VTRAVITPGDPYMLLPNDKIVKKIYEQVCFPCDVREAFHIQYHFNNDKIFRLFVPSY